MENTTFEQILSQVSTGEAVSLGTLGTLLLALVSLFLRYRNQLCRGTRVRCFSSCCYGGSRNGSTELDEEQPLEEPRRRTESKDAPPPAMMSLPSFKD